MSRRVIVIDGSFSKALAEIAVARPPAEIVVIDKPVFPDPYIRLPKEERVRDWEQRQPRKRRHK